ncbi:SWI SNF- matrix-associated actin-dependent regulator of chromatin sub D [Coelomomyces lativittatus]|nr:SWI SNF- matrix-associated actin-dependent regulator of chromatin sub D [Coelomomyces lativittatus]
MSTHKRKRPIDVNLPNNIEEIIPESLFYKRLQEAEKKIDATISRKNITIQELLSKPIRVRKILRIFISNYATQQTHPLNDSVRNQALPNSWTLRIEGRLLDSQEKPSNVNKKFSHFVKQVVVEIDNDPNFYSEPNFAEYYKEVGKEVDFDGIEVKRKGNADVPVKIVIRLDFGPEKFKLSKELDQIVMHDIGGPSKIGIDQLLTKSEVVLAIWQYIKQHKLFDVDDKKYVNCDLTLRNLFGLEKILFAQIPDQINRYLLPADPIVIHYINTVFFEILKHLEV